MAELNSRGYRLIVAATAANLALAAALLAVAGFGVDGTELALRMTARVSFLWFLTVFVAGPLQRLRPSRVGAWLFERRAALGVVFGLSMSIHVGFILRLYALHPGRRPPMVTDADFYIGVPGLVLVAALTVTSFAALKRALSPRAWRGLHRTGIWVVWAIFFLCLVDSVGRKETHHPFIAYHLFIGLLLAAMGLRAAASRKRREPARS
jgi:sulfoxide reductase heme-binding subunit YedZ